ncbi:ATP-binding protein [Nannocystis sp.]|uniref:sensor histidine kinase n=1 Tax=Nannocystis sp. TaxID=1962667 RepID=UPI0025DF4E69|nr:ATP-binding protein [Nannocystis sp.]MBK7828129.1 hypothetical protein [Nannocystis sp.]
MASRQENRSLPRLFWLALALILGFAVWCVWLVRAVEQERAQVAERVGWLGEAQALQQSLGRGGSIEAELRRLAEATAASGGASQTALQAALASDDAAARREAIDGFVRAVRGETAELSQRLGQRWSALYVLTLAALLSAATALALLVVATWRQRRAEALQRSLAEALAAVETARAEADAANANKTAYVTHMSHELRTPLNAILGYTALLREVPAVAADPEAAADLQRVALAGEHVLALINEVLDISRIEAGHLELRAASFELGALLESVVELLRGQASAGVVLRFELAPDLATRRVGDAPRIRQVIVNLVANALRYTQAGSVVLRTSGSVGQVKVEVEDTGVGISRVGLTQLFRPFAQVDGGDRRGSGVGLALCKRLVEAMGGQIGVESEVGKGSLFWVALPLPVG